MSPPVERIAARLDSQLPSEAVAADGFPIDPVLQKRARRAAIGYGLLALYYVAVLPFLLRYVRWGSLATILEDLFARMDLIVSLLSYVAANVVLAVCAWRVVALSRWASWVVIGLATVFTGWAGANLGLALWRSLATASSTGFVHIGLNVALLGAYVVCLVMLVRAVSAFNSQRAAALAQFEGRMQR